MKKIIVIGAGAWGTSIANLAAKNSDKIFLSASKKTIVEEINSKNTNHNFLPHISLSKNITAIHGFETQIESADLVFIVTPSSAVLEILTKISKLKLKKECGFIICSKGVEQKSLTFLSDLFENIMQSNNYAVLSGPNFAIEVANDVPTITTIASKNKNLFETVKNSLNNKVFKVHYLEDPRTAEICGVIKNVIAIGCGIMDGLNLGVNAKSALVVKGTQEIKSLCDKIATTNDLNNAAGFGDIFLTCSSRKSRNKSLGEMIAIGKSYEEIVKETGKTYEGVLSAHSITEIAKKLKLRLDLCEQISEILSGKFSPAQIEQKITNAILS